MQNLPVSKPESQLTPQREPEPQQQRAQQPELKPEPRTSTWRIWGGIFALFVALGIALSSVMATPSEEESWDAVLSHVDSESEGALQVEELPFEFVLYADDEEAFRLAAFETEGFDADAYTPLPASTVNSFNSKVLPALAAGSFPLATTALLAHPNLKMTTAVGRLAPAAAGTGFRGVVKGASGQIIGHGLLTNPTGLIITGGVLTVASVVFALNHQPGTVKALRELNQKVDLILKRMETELMGEVQSISETIEAAKLAAEQGDFDAYRRQKLEDFETDLHRIASQTRGDVYNALERSLEPDSWGSEKTYESALDKYKDLQLKVAIHNYVVNLRTLNWYVRALYPGENSVVDAELDNLQAFLVADEEIEKTLSTVAEQDQEAIRSFWNKGETLEERRNEVAQHVALVRKERRAGHQRAEENLALLRELTVSQRSVSEFIIEMKDGKAVAMYQAN